MKHFLATGEGPVLNQRIEITSLHRDGHEFPIELSITPLKMAGKHEFTAFIRDITDQKHQQAETLRFKNILDNTLVVLGFTPAVVPMTGTSIRLFVAIVRDVTEHKQVETLHARLGHILDISLNEIHVFDAETLRIVQVNQRGKSLWTG